MVKGNLISSEPSCLFSILNLGDILAIEKRDYEIFKNFRNYLIRLIRLTHVLYQLIRPKITYFETQLINEKKTNILIFEKFYDEGRKLKYPVSLRSHSKSEPHYDILSFQTKIQESSNILQGNGFPCTRQRFVQNSSNSGKIYNKSHFFYAKRAFCIF